MKTVLVQRTNQSILGDVLASIERKYETVLVDDNDLGGALESHGRDVAGLVLFELSDAAYRFSAMLRNERFCHPMVPIAYCGVEGVDTALPFRARRFDSTQLDTLREFLGYLDPLEVLVVEDDEDIRDYLTLCLSRFHSVVAAADGEAGLNQLQVRQYEAVVLDVMLPGISGEAVFEYLRENHPEIAVVVVTAYDSEHREIEFTFRGAAAYLCKPFGSNKAFRQELMRAAMHHHEWRAIGQRSRRSDAYNAARKQYAAQMSRYT